MSMILITGSRGFIGSELTFYFQNKGYDALGINIDIRDKKELRPYFQNSTFVIHAAGKVKKGIPDQETYYSTNVLGTRNVIELCLENNCKLIHLSSIVADGPFIEEVPYAISKLASQNLVEDFCLNKNLKAITLKLCVIYSKENDTHRKGARYQIEKLLEDIENIINTYDFNIYKLIDYS
jgi:nucleoside-diphosphate-sugar epimerase